MNTGMVLLFTEYWLSGWPSAYHRC